MPSLRNGMDDTNITRARSRIRSAKELLLLSSIIVAAGTLHVVVGKGKERDDFGIFEVTHDFVDTQVQAQTNNFVASSTDGHLILSYLNLARIHALTFLYQAINRSLQLLYMFHVSGLYEPEHTRTHGVREIFRSLRIDRMRQQRG